MHNSHRRQEGSSDSFDSRARSVGLAIATAVACLALTPTPVFAAGIEHPDVGTIAIGRGGANAAAPSDGLALMYNPAGFASQSGLRVTVDGNMAWQGLSFTPPGGVKESNSAGGFLVPALAVSYGFPRGRLSNLTLALGATGPSAIGKESFRPGGAQRYALISSDYFIAYYSAAIAARFTRWISAGVTIQLVKGSAKFSQAVWSGTSMGTGPENDSIAKVDVTSPFIPTAVFGVTVRPVPPLALGVSFRPRFDFLAHGKLTTQLPPAQQATLDIKVLGDSTDFFVPFPDLLRFGAQYQFGSRLLVEADLVAEFWSRMHTIEIRPRGIEITSSIATSPVPLGDIIFQKDYKNAYSVRVGGDFLLLPGRLTVRAGYLHETTAIPLRSVSVDFGNWQRDVVSVGGTVQLGRGISASFAYAHHFLADQNVTDSNVVQVVTPCVLVLPCSPPAPTVVGNGLYKASLDVASLALGFVLDDFRRAPPAAATSATLAAPPP
jgi:long-subunit fatty acid transport protein